MTDVLITFCIHDRNRKVKPLVSLESFFTRPLSIFLPFSPEDLTYTASGFKFCQFFSVHFCSLSFTEAEPCFSFFGMASNIVLFFKAWFMIA